MVELAMAFMVVVAAKALFSWLASRNKRRTAERLETAARQFEAAARTYQAVAHKISVESARQSPRKDDV